VSEFSRIKDKYYILATSSATDPHRLVLKHCDTFGVFDRFGDIFPLGEGELGLYHEGTRMVSWYELRINGKRPLFLSSNVSDDNTLLNVDLTNPDIYSKGKLLLKRDIVHIMRSMVLFDARCFEHIRIKNFGLEPVEFLLEFVVNADFKDIFEIRGLKRRKKGKFLSPVYKNGHLRLSYKGLDGVIRTTSFKFAEMPYKVEGKISCFKIKLNPGGIKNIFCTISCVTGRRRQSRMNFESGIQKARERLRELNDNCAGIYTSNELFNESVKRSLSDIKMMLTETKYGLYPYSGIPWYCTAFGRDGIITALESLWINPDVAKGVLKYLAARQARDFNRAKAAEPGKILHETRKGELAALNEIPFGLYYGSVDSTPLFVMLAGAYWRRTGDTDLIKKLWGNIEAALLWMKNYGDVDADGFLEYFPDKEGLFNQGWKDSYDAVFHKDGSFPEGPIALCEVQGYMYAAKKEAAALARLVGKESYSQQLLNEAKILRERFNKIFWDKEMGSYVLALDGKKKPCRVMASNAGHTLFTGIADKDKALQTAKLLTSEPMFSGWGIRTVGINEALYNPMSYHNGSVWPHDNALIASGFAAYGLRKLFIKVFSALFDASLFMEFQRLPELFSGFHRREGVGPTLYPVACTPQTWASGSLLLMLQACLGIDFEPANERLILRNPFLPQFLEQVQLKDLAVTPKKTVDLLIRRYGEDVTIEVLKKSESVTVLII